MVPHPLIDQYVNRQGVPDALHPDGHATIVIDDKYRVHLSGARNGWVAISARLRELPSRGADRDEILSEIGRLAAGRLRPHPSACVVDPAERTLLLQQMVRPDASAAAFDEAIASFVNGLSFWVGAVRRM